MQLDIVHDVQQAYRRLVTATSFPGRIVDIGAEAAKVDLDSDLPRPFLLLAIMLLDAEVGSFIASERADRHARLLSQLTYSRTAPAEGAAFLFLAQGAWAAAPAAIDRASVGTLVDPHRGATIVLEVRDLGSPPVGSGNTHSLVLTGPGIETATTILVDGPDGWVEARARKNAEFPLGIDFILVTAEGRMASLPRTTQLEVSEWAT
jgi:alpha-D-ribose 1-methylphosphonate 5-triphosphate synthase subunit PhnH